MSTMMMMVLQRSSLHSANRIVDSYNPPSNLAHMTMRDSIEAWPEDSHDVISSSHIYTYKNEHHSIEFVDHSRNNKNSVNEQQFYLSIYIIFRLFIA